MRLVGGRLSEHLKGGTLELNGDLGVPFGQAFAGSQIKRDARPPPIIYVQPQRHEGLRSGFRRDSWFGPIASYSLAVWRALTILAAHAPTQHIFGI
jgi:hypothetical protein